VSTQQQQPFLAIILATNRPQHVAAFLENLRETAEDPGSFEVLIRVDEGDDATYEAIRAQQKLSGFRVQMLVERNDKPFLHNVIKSYDRLTFEMSSPSVYFFWNLTDEIRLQTKGWDRILKGYMKLYGDDVFRIEPSKCNLRNYYTLEECVHSPDNYPVTTRRWLSLVGGWGDCWGTDSWQQCIDWYLGQCRIPVAPRGLFRSVPVFLIVMDGQEDGQVVSEGQDMRYRYRLQQGIMRVFASRTARENFNRLAQRLHAHTVAKQRGLNEYILRENRHTKQITLLAPNDTIIGVFGWSLRLASVHQWLVSFVIRYLGDGGRNAVIKAKRVVKFFLKPLRAANELQSRPSEIAEYHFNESENRLFPSGEDSVARLIDAL